MLAFDTAMAIFNNVPPRISFSELDVQLPCDSMYFELSSYSEMLNRATFPKPKMKLIDAFQKLFVPTVDLPRTIEKDSLNCWDMLFLIHCLYTYVWRQTFANPLLRPTPSSMNVPSYILDPLKLAIVNWKVVWDEIRSNLTREQLRDMGFETSADSYWTLTKLIVHRFDPKSNTSPRECHSAASSMSYPSTTTVNLGGVQISVKDEPMVGPGGHASSDTATGTAEYVPTQTTNTGGFGGGVPVVDFMPIDTDLDSQGAHLRKILRRGR